MTAQGRTTTAKLTVGSRILVERSAVDSNLLRSTTRKLTGRNGVEVATITNVVPIVQSNGRRSTTYKNLVTDLGVVELAAPSQTFGLAPELELVTLAHPEVCGAYVHTPESVETGACRCGQPGVTTTRQAREAVPSQL